MIIVHKYKVGQNVLVLKDINSEKFKCHMIMKNVKQNMGNLSIPKSTYSLQNTSFRTLSDATDFHQYNVTAYWTQQGGQQNASQTSTITLLPNETAIK